MKEDIKEHWKEQQEKYKKTLLWESETIMRKVMSGLLT